jgi:hypothetical protein
MGHENGVADGADVAESVEVLGHHQKSHDLMRIDAMDTFLEVEDSVA